MMAQALGRLARAVPPAAPRPVSRGAPPIGSLDGDGATPFPWKAVSGYPRERMLELKCPSCGAPVSLAASASVSAVCSYCGTTVARADEAGAEALKNLGKISAVVQDSSPLRIGASGKAFGKGFRIVGRLQLEHEAGYWNEWFLLYDDNETGWLGEALGQYFVTTQALDTKTLPRFEALRMGQVVPLPGAKTFRVMEKKRAVATGGEGELPFVVGKGYELPYADLRNEASGFATIDYSETPPLVFVGQCVDWDALELQDYRAFDGWN